MIFGDFYKKKMKNQKNFSSNQNKEIDHEIIMNSRDVKMLDFILHSQIYTMSINTKHKKSRLRIEWIVFQLACVQDLFIHLNLF